jgi:hypothetical protein
VAPPEIPPERRTITAAEAQRTLGVPRGTITGWASVGRLHAVSIDADGTRWYRLADVLDLAATTTRRAPHRRPSRSLHKVN